MTTDQSPTHHDCAIAPEAQGWPQISDQARDAGDRVFCLVLATSVAVAIVLGAAWVWAMPSVR